MPLSKKIEDIISALSLEQKLSQLFMVGYYGYLPDSDLVDWVESSLGGLIFFRDNINSPVDIAKVIADLQHKSNIGMFVSIDQEGGLVERVNGLVQVPTPMALAATCNPVNVSKANDIIAEDLSALGFNLNYTPVLDVNNEPSNPIIGVRSFGDNIESVFQYGFCVIESMREANIIPVAKHFPGHGAANIDSHLALPSIDCSYEELYDIHLSPFRLAIVNNIEMIMVCHVLFSRITNDGLPASLSKSIISDLLIGKLSYEGVIITDDLNMSAISDTYSVENAAYMSLNAGVDILLYRDYKNGLCAYNYLLEKLYSGDLSVERIDRSLRKILSLKDKYSILTAKYSFDINDIHARVNDKKKKELSQSLFDLAITVYKDCNVLNFFENKPKCLVVSVDRSKLVHYKSEVDINLSSFIENSDEIKVSLNPDKSEVDNIVKVLKDYDLLILVSYNAYFNSNQADLFKFLIEKKDCLLLAAGSPYDASLFIEARYVALSYGYSNSSIISFSKLLKAGIKGNTNPPINIPSLR